MVGGATECSGGAGGGGAGAALLAGLIGLGGRLRAFEERRTSFEDILVGVAEGNRR